MEVIMNQRYTPEHYRDLLLTCLPPGKSITKKPGTNVNKLMHGIAEELSRINSLICDIISKECLPSKTDALLSDWEDEFGIIPASWADDDYRRKYLLRKVITIGQQYKSFFEDIINELFTGFSIEVKEYKPAWAGFFTAGSECGKQDSIFKWLIRLGGVFADDWYVPSKDEAYQMWWNLVSDQSSDNWGNGKRYAGSLGDFQEANYWTSSGVDDDVTSMYHQDFNQGFSGYSTKTQNFYIRPIRNFVGKVGDYELKDIGPMGGYIFLIVDTEDEPDSEIGDRMFYEAAQSNLEFRNVDGWGSNAYEIYSVTDTGVGAGKDNTDDINQLYFDNSDQCYITMFVLDIESNERTEFLEAIQDEIKRSVPGHTKVFYDSIKKREFLPSISRNVIFTKHKLHIGFSNEVIDIWQWIVWNEGTQGYQYTNKLLRINQNRGFEGKLYFYNIEGVVIDKDYFTAFPDSGFLLPSRNKYLEEWRDDGGLDWHECNWFAGNYLRFQDLVGDDDHERRFYFTRDAICKINGVVGESINVNLKVLKKSGRDTGDDGYDTIVEINQGETYDENINLESGYTYVFKFTRLLGGGPWDAILRGTILTSENNIEVYRLGNNEETKDGIFGVGFSNGFKKD